jgi:hypothetical protein
VYVWVYVVPVPVVLLHDLGWICIREGEADSFSFCMAQAYVFCFVVKKEMVELD